MFNYLLSYLQSTYRANLLIGQKEPIKFHSQNLPLRRRRRPSCCWSAVNVAVEDAIGNVAARSDVINVFHKIAGLRAGSPFKGYRERSSGVVGSFLAGSVPKLQNG